MSTACLGVVLPRIASKTHPRKTETVSPYDDYLTIGISGKPGCAAVAAAAGYVAVCTTVDTYHVARVAAEPRATRRLERRRSENGELCPMTSLLCLAKARKLQLGRIV